jgi:hypothetical protein
VGSHHWQPAGLKASAKRLNEFPWLEKMEGG